MKTYTYAIVFFTSIILTSCFDSRNINSSYSNDQSSQISYQQFYDDLSPYGRWVNNPEFGYVWAPAESGFQPYYSNGHWAYTNYGWTWVSNYDWGWATFHYGRWFYDDFNGWLWVPGYEWAPAWVNWRQSRDYYGWAPLCPRRRDGSYYQVQNDQWAFVPQQYINRIDINNYFVTRQNNTTIINNTTVINNININKPRNINGNVPYQPGPNLGEVEQVTRTKINALIVKHSTAPGNAKLQNGVLQIYRPVVKQGNINSSNDKSELPRGLPGNQAQNPGVKTIVPQRNINVRPAGATDVNDAPSAVRPGNITNPPEEKTRRVRIFEPNPDLPGGTVRSNPNYQNTPAPNPGNSGNDASPKKVLVNPNQNPQFKIIQRPNAADNQQQNPVNNQRTFNPSQNPPIERPNNLNDKRPQFTPQNPPANLNRENNGGKQIRVIR